MKPQPNHIYKCYWSSENPIEDDIYYVNVVTDIEGNTVYGYCIDTNRADSFHEITDPGEVLEWSLSGWGSDEAGTIILLGTINDFPEWFI